MKNRATTRVIIYKEGQVLLSRTEGMDFWYPGGGGLEDGEDLKECAEREVKEETGMVVKILDLMYFQEFFDHAKDERSLEFFFLAEPSDESGYDPKHRDDDQDGRTPLAESRWFSREDFASGEYRIKPDFFQANFWQDFDNENGKINRYFKRVRQ